jgi:hypothetical protein
MSRGTDLTTKINLLLLPAVAEIRGEGVQRGYNAAVRDVIALLTEGGDESKDDADTIQYVVARLKDNMQEYGMTDEFLHEVDY